MGEVRSLTSLSETDYEAIAGAVMETARGRWFMAEFAKRNRQADTVQLLNAIQRIERIVGAGATQPAPEPNLREAAALIGDLRLDLERISGRSGEPSSGLAARIESASGAIMAANEAVQEAAWGLRETGADDAACDALDRRSTEIHAATVTIESTAQQIGKIADTIAMLDSSLRAFCETAREVEVTPPAPVHRPATPLFGLPEAAPLGAYEDIEIVEIDEAPTSVLAEPRPVSARPAADLKLQASPLVDEDVVFEDLDAIDDPLDAPHVIAAATSEAELRALDALPAERKLAYFA
jgi:hypothetical protein